MEKFDELVRKFKIYNDSMSALMDECSKGQLDLLDWEVQKTYKEFKKVKEDLIEEINKVVF